MDREKVIKGLECCLGSNDCDVEPKEDCPYKGMCLCAMALHLDVLALLKKQDAVEPHSHLTDDSDLYFTCGKCGHVIWSESYRYCPMCGLKIAWNGE